MGTEKREVRGLSEKKTFIEFEVLMDEKGLCGSSSFFLFRVASMGNDHGDTYVCCITGLKRDVRRLTIVVRDLGVGRRSSLLGAEATLGDGVAKSVAVTAEGTSRLNCVESILAVRW